MNAGFSSLAALKRELLMPADLSKTDQDASVKALGLGVASMFESLANRKFARATESVEFPADRCSVVVPRYPIEAVTLVEVRDSIATGWQAQAGLPDNYLPLSGIVQFFTPPGIWPASMKVTYTGGYWWDQGEVTPDAMPSGAIPLPEDLRAAWVMQCRWFWERRSITDRAKAGFGEDTALGFAVSQDDLLMPVRQVIATYRRIAQ